MNRLVVICLSLSLSAAVSAQDDGAGLQDWLGGVRQWLEENVDDTAFEFVGLDRTEVDAGLEQLQEAAAQPQAGPPLPTRADADSLIATLDQFELTREGAAWLQTLLGVPPPAPAPPELPAAPPIAEAPRDPLRLAWEQRLLVRPKPERAEEYVPVLKSIFAEEGVPPALVWIAEVESGFDPAARSRAGALGLFQLMPDTAEELGLSVGLFGDERRDPAGNARAAARYLRALGRQFQDWQLALAAYNAGPGRVAYWLEKLDATSYGAIADRLPEETRHYIPKVEATVWVREGVELRTLPLRPNRTTDIRGAVRGLPASERTALHQGHGSATPPAGGGG